MYAYRVHFRHHGNFDNTKKFLNSIRGRRYLRDIEKCGLEGVDALAAATPKDTGYTASCWYYEFVMENNNAMIAWSNSHVEHYINIAIILQYGHGTGTGGYVHGRDYINPAMEPILDRWSSKIWKEVTSS